jgi:lysophospholipase L1-like esterase
MKFLFIAILCWGNIANAQQSGAKVEDRQRIDELEKMLAAHRRLLMDWGGLLHYGSDDAELRKPAPGVKRVVFIGDDITEHWGEGKSPFFPGKPYVNRGISRQTTGQMLIRFRQDVIDLLPAVVVIQGGSNDMARFAGIATEGMIADNFMTMAELAKAHGIKVVLASVTPVCDCFRKLTDLRMPGKIMGLNSWIKSYAAKNGLVYLDYYSALADGRSMKQTLTVDGLVPNDAGYETIAPLAEQAIAQALGK